MIVRQLYICLHFYNYILKLCSNKVCEAPVLDYDPLHGSVLKANVCQLNPCCRLPSVLEDLSVVWLKDVLERNSRYGPGSHTII